IQLCDKKISEFNAKIEAKKSLLDETSKLIAEREKELKQKKKELDKIVEETEKEEKELISKSEKAASAVDERLIKAYRRIRNAYRNGLAVVAVVRGACGGCYTRIPPQRQMEIRQRKRIITCEHCGRILVDFSAKENE
ncbi:MAG: C4-type zinc ribbon domain-containing protein, partial [Chitinophagales bacterium]|nr:C4-type zinc ribbon domain-containing protein [Chitinophagales bacterium]